MRNRFGGGLRLLLAIVVGHAVPAFAEEIGDIPPDSTVVPVPGITVTGSRSPENPLDTPAALSVVPRSRFENTRQIGLADALDRVPGVFTQSRGGAQDVRITIRGYGARGNGERSNAGNMRGIRVMTDGIPLTEPDGRTSLELVDLGSAGQIEVLRSNGSILYGNASGGVVQLRSDFPGPGFDLQGRAGSFGFHREQGILGYRLGSARGATSAFVSTFDGWREHSQSATTSIQNRLSAPLGESSRLGLLLDFASNFNRFPGPLTEDELEADPQQADSAFLARDERRFNRVGRVGVTFDSERGGQRLSLATWIEPKVLQRSERNRFRDFTRYHVGGSATWQIESHLGSAARAVWMVGGDEQYQDGAIQFYTLETDGSRGTSLIANKREGANSAGGFAQVEVRLGEAWSLRAAARYDNLWYLSEDRIEPTLNATRHFTQVTPKGSIARHFSRHTVYASVGGGVEAPAFNEIDPPPTLAAQTSLNPFLEPMRSTSYELGAKGALAGEGEGLGGLRYDAALYWIDVLDDIVPWNGGAYFYTAGRTRRRGGELGLDWTPTSAVTLRGSLTVSDNEYREYANDADDYSGNEIAGLPPAFADAEARVRVLPGLSLSGRARYVGRYFADDANAAQVDAFTLLGAEAEYQVATAFGGLRAFVSVDNLTDEDYVASAFINGIQSRFYEPGLPRNVAAGLRLSFAREGD